MDKTGPITPPFEVLESYGNLDEASAHLNYDNKEDIESVNVTTYIATSDTQPLYPVAGVGITKSGGETLPSVDHPLAIPDIRQTPSLAGIQSPGPTDNTNDVNKHDLPSNLNPPLVGENGH